MTVRAWLSGLARAGVFQTANLTCVRGLVLCRYDGGCGCHCRCLVSAGFVVVVDEWQAVSPS